MHILKQERLKELNINRWTLFFNDPQIERNFKEEYFSKSLVGYRVSIVVVTFLYALLGFLDYYTANLFYKEFFIIRYVIITPALVIAFLSSFHPKFKYFWQELTTVCYVIGGSGIVYMMLRNPESFFYYGGIFLILMAGYFFIKLHFIWAVIPGVLIVVIYNISAFYFNILGQLNIEHLIITNTFFVSANIIAIVALYNNKLMERTEFYRRVLLSKQQNRIKSINENLEAKVQERTQLLEKRNKVLNDAIITRKDIEKKLLLAKRHAEESDRLKSAFLANMSHEIRTPMNGIIGFLDMISDPEITRDEQQQYLDVVQQSGTRLLQTINDIVEISQIEAGEVTKTISDVDLNKTFKYIFDFFAPNLEGKNIELELGSNITLNKIRTDSNKLESILMNLVNNALKFTNEGSIEIGVSKKGDKLRFYVKDTGKGIPKDRQKAIFDRFVQADLSLTRGHEGSGLGLAICKAYVELLGGKINVKSKLNKGTNFYFTIDYQPAEKTSALPNLVDAIKENTSEKPMRATALVAEDDSVSYCFLETILKQEHIDVIWAKNGVEALELYQKHSNISLIIMDIKMPVMDGIEATLEIRKLDKKIPIIAQTAFALSGDKEKALKAGCNDYLSKPLKRRDLIASIENLLHLNTPLKPEMDKIPASN